MSAFSPIAQYVKRLRNIDCIEIGVLAGLYFTTHLNLVFSLIAEIGNELRNEYMIEIANFRKTNIHKCNELLASTK